MQDVTRYLFLHGHILKQQSPDSMRAFPGFPPWTKSWSAALGAKLPRQTVVSTLCCHSPWTPKETLEFPAPHIWLVTLVDSCHRALRHSSHTKLLTVPPPPGIHWNWPAVLLGTVWQLSTFNSPSLQFASEISVASCSWLIMWTNMGFLWKINKSNGLSNCMERLS